MRGAPGAKGARRATGAPELCRTWHLTHVAPHAHRTSRTSHLTESVAAATRWQSRAATSRYRRRSPSTATSRRRWPLPRKAAFTPSASAMFIADGADSRAAEANRERQLRQLVAHQRNVGGLERGVAADRAHGDADIGGRQRRRVVDAVARPSPPVPIVSRKLANGADLVIRQQPRPHILDAHATRERLRARPRDRRSSIAMCATPAARSRSITSRADPRGVSASAIDADAPASPRTSAVVRPRPRARSIACCAGDASTPRSCSHRALPTSTREPVDRRLRAQAVRRLEARPARGARPSPFGARDDRGGRSDAAIAPRPRPRAAALGRHSPPAAGPPRPLPAGRA